MAVQPETGVRFATPAIGDDEVNEVVATLRSGWLSTGPRVHAFERAFAEYIGVPHAVALNSCTAALHLSMLAAGVGPGDEVVTTPLTFCATANVVMHVGATPRFADIDPLTWNLDPAAAAAAVTPRTRVVLPVHYAGRPVDVRAFREIASRHGLTLVEDAAHCVEGRTGAKIGCRLTSPASGRRI
jgi:dTDP-4-amino-4,6-dideoxygalactose transaminase